MTTILKVGSIITIPSQNGEKTLTCVSKINMKRFELGEKFWEIFLDDRDNVSFAMRYNIRYNIDNTEKLGSFSQSVDFAGQEERDKKFQERIEQKINDGYKLVSNEETSFIYVFSDGTERRKWISSFDLDEMLNNLKARVEI